jgi:hypothetical protein
MSYATGFRMVKLRVLGDSVNLRSEPSSAGGQSTVIEAVAGGELVDQEGPASGHPDWVKVRSASGIGGFMKRMLLCQNDPGQPIDVPPNLLKAYNDAIVKATNDFDNVRYKLGKKDPNTGLVDCSGWICFVNKLGFNAVNQAAGRQVFTSDILRMLNTHSDHQVSLPGYRVEQIISITDIDRLNFRPGLLIGVNYSDYNWERGQGRVFEIDHIVQTMKTADGTLYVTQSSSSGDGVNRVRLGRRGSEGAPGVGWLSSTSPQLEANRMHVIDIFRLANLAPRPSSEPQDDEKYLELSDPDLSLAMPG